MSDSEESDGFGYLVEHTAHDELDDSDHESDHSGVGSGSESDMDDAHRNDLFDLEAADSDDDRSGSDENGADHDESDAWEDNHYFPQFKRLPFELRHQIWEWFCPDLTAKSRVYWFYAGVWNHNKPGRCRDMVVAEGPFLEQQTRPARAMSAVHQESRQLALRTFPDALSFDNHAVLRFNAARDIVFLGSTEAVMLELEALPRVPGFSENVQHLAIEPAVLNDLELRSSALFGAFENLKTVYYTINPNEHRPQHLHWCTSDLVKRYSLATFEEEPGLGEDGEHVYCWPDVENHCDFADAEVPLDALADDLRRDVIHIKGASFDGVPIWPMAQFLWDSDLRRFDKLLEWDGKGELDWESSDEEDDGEPDEYESEGIDDSDLSDDSLQSDIHDDLVVLDDGESDHGREISEDGSSAASGSPPGSPHPGDQAGAIDLTGDDDEQIAEFSSPEQSSATLQGSDDSAEESDLPAPRPARLKRSRGRVVESDSEDDSDDPLPRKRARTDSRQNPIILSSDDEEDERRKMRANRRTRAVMPEDEDEEEGDETNGHPRGTDWSGLSGSGAEEDDSDSEEEAAVSKPLSLAEKLQLHRQNNPIPVSDDDDSGMEEMGGDDYDARNYADFQDDEEGNEVSGEGEDGDEHDLILGDEVEDEDDYGY
jgi:hypothetical protein